MRSKCFRPAGSAPSIPLEKRELLSVARNTFAQLDGRLGGSPSKFVVDYGDFAMPRGRVLVGLLAEGINGADPGTIRVEGIGRSRARTLLSKADTAGANSSLALASFGPGGFSAAAAPQGIAAPGGYRLDFFLVGDANYDFRVDTRDIRLIRELQGVTSDDLRYYLPEADADRDGVIGRSDLRLAQQNLGASTRIRPLQIDLVLDHPTDPDRNGQVKQEVVGVVGRTLPGRRVRLDFGANGTFDQSAVADARGWYGAAGAVPPGFTAVEAVISDGFGQVAAARAAVDRLVDQSVDGIPPTVVITSTSFTEGAYVNQNVTISGTVADNFAGVRALLAWSFGREPQVVPFDPKTGQFQFTTNMPLDGTADATRRVDLLAVDNAMNLIWVFSPKFTLDTVPPFIDRRTDADLGVVSENPTVIWVHQEINHRSLVCLLDSQVPLEVHWFLGTRISWARPNLPLDGTADGKHTIEIIGEDRAGNKTVVTHTFWLETDGE